MIIVNEKLLDEILEDAKRTYPYEGCGILIGNNQTIKEAVFVKNICENRLHDRYEIDPADFVKADKLAREKSMEIVGFYHSHPDHPPRPSAFDVETAWPDYIYLIVSVKNGKDPDPRAWIFIPEQKEFKAENIVVKGE